MKPATPTPIVITFNRDFHEYKACPKDADDQAAYFTDDYDDALGTARLMAAGGEIIDRTRRARHAARAH